MFTLPAPLLPALLRLHAWAMRREYFDLPGYMNRGWLVGYHSAARNHDNKQWHGRTLGRLHAWITERIAIRAHTILRSDNERHLHDHPVDSISIVLQGGYWEVCAPTPAAIRFPAQYIAMQDYLRFAMPEKDAELMAAFGMHWRGPGSIVCRRAEQAHRLVIPSGNPPAKTLWVLGKKRRSWGFHTSDGWKHWRDYLGIGA